MKPKYPLCDVRSRELIWGGPDHILTYDDFDPYQCWMADRAINLEGCYLAAEPGLGKTGTSLFTMTKWMERGIAHKPLVIAPLYVTENTWPDELHEWDFARGLRYSVITGDEEQRLWAANRDADVYFMNRENLRWLYLTFPGTKFFWDSLVYDEASRLKAGKKRTRPNNRITEFGALAKMAFRFNRKLLLSGTPAASKGLEDLWAPLYIMDGGERLGRTKTAFYQRWFSYNQWSRKYTPHAHAKDEIMSRVADVVFSLKTEDYLSLPPLVVKDFAIQLSDTAMEKYRRFEREFLLEEYDIEAVSKGVLANKLLQLANGSLYREDDDPVRIHDEKLDALAAIAEMHEGTPLLVAYSFEFDKDAILKRFPKARVFGESEDDLRDWNKGEIPMLLVHPASAGHGLNFQRGSNVAVWYGLNWSLELYQQFVKRLWRRGQKGDRVYMWRILAKRTYDYRVVDVLDDKDATQEDITDAVRIRV